MKYVEKRPYAEPALAARRLLEIAGTIEPIQDGLIHIAEISASFLREGGTPAEHTAALNYAILQGWLWKHESGTFVRLTAASAEMFARSAAARALSMNSRPSNPETRPKSAAPKI